jgi:hypothetical protein
MVRLEFYPHRKFHIDVIPGAKPKHVQPYAIARIHLEPFKKELDHLVCIKVLSPQGASECRKRMDAYVGSVTYVNLTK